MTKKTPKSIYVVLSKDDITLGNTSHEDVQRPQIPMEKYKKLLKAEGTYEGLVKFPSGNNLVIAEIDGKEYYVFALKDVLSPWTKLHLSLPAGFPKPDDFVYENGEVDVEKTIKRTSDREFEEELGVDGTVKIYTEEDMKKLTSICPYFTDAIGGKVVVKNPKKFWDKEFVEKNGEILAYLNRPIVLIEKKTFEEANYGELVPAIVFSGKYDGKEAKITRWESDVPLTLYGITSFVKTNGDRDKWAKIMLQIIDLSEFYKKNKNHTNLLGLPEPRDMYTEALYGWFVDHREARNKLEEFFG